MAVPARSAGSPPRASGRGEGGIRTPDSLAAIAVFETAAINRTRPPLRVATPSWRCALEAIEAGGPDRIRTGVLGLDRAACLARLHHGTDGPEVYQLRNGLQSRREKGKGLPIMARPVS